MARKTVSRKRKAAAAATAGTGGLQGEQVRGEGGWGEALVPGGGQGCKRRSRGGADVPGPGRSGVTLPGSCGRKVSWGAGDPGEGQRGPGAGQG